jgi:hypothetical protein
MSRRDYAEGVVKDLCAEMGLRGLAFDEHGCSSLSFDDVLVTFAHVSAPVEHLSIYVDLGALPSSGGEATNVLLELNLQAWLRQCMTVGLDPAGERALGWNVIPVPRLTVAALGAVLQAMLQAAFGIREALARPELTGAPALAGEPPGTPRPFDPGFIRA